MLLNKPRLPTSLTARTWVHRHNAQIVDRLQCRVCTVLPQPHFTGGDALVTSIQQCHSDKFQEWRCFRRHSECGFVMISLPVRALSCMADCIKPVQGLGAMTVRAHPARYRVGVSTNTAQPV